MIDRVNASVDLYSHLRLEVTLQPRGQPKEGMRNDGVEQAPRRREGVTLQLQTDERQRSGRPQDPADEKLVPFEFASALTDQPSDGGWSAQEVLPALTASVVPSNPLLARAAAVYTRAGGLAASAGKLGTRLNAVA